MCSSCRESQYFRDRAEAGLTWSLDQAEGIFPQRPRIHTKPRALSAVPGEEAHASFIFDFLFCLNPYISMIFLQPWFQKGFGWVKHLQANTTQEFVESYSKQQVLAKQNMFSVLGSPPFTLMTALHTLAVLSVTWNGFRFTAVLGGVTCELLLRHEGLSVQNISRTLNVSSSEVAKTIRCDDKTLSQGKEEHTNAS